MTNLILPGFSIKNKDWAETIKKELSPDFHFEVVYWKHWELGGNALGLDETDKLIEIIGNNKFNIIAKSVGSLLAMRMFQKVKPEKFILCGVPLNDLSEDDKKFYEILKEFDPKNVLVIQNNEDPHGSYNEAKKFIHAVNPSVEIISKEANTHEYDYPDDFKSFLRS